MTSRILVTTSQSWRTTALRRIDVGTGRNYGDALVRVGLLPFMTAPLAPDLSGDLLDGMDGVLFSGGADLDPQHFDQAPHPDLGAVDPVRDAFELALYRAARERNLPVLGVCRGIQVIAVGEGGSLHQHLPALPGMHQHEQSAIAGDPAHRVDLATGSALARAVGSDAARVNSYHHQGIDRLPDGFDVVATAADGLVEAVEARSGAFALGVQWHPEMSFERHPEQIAPFVAFAAAVSARGEPVPSPVG